MGYTLLENKTSVPGAWFDAQISRHHEKTTHATLISLYDEEIKVLKAYHDGRLEVNGAARDITRPISNSPIPELGGYSDDAIPLCHLWGLLINALIEWPSSRTPDLVAFIAAISKVPEPIHLGQALDDDDQPRMWSSIPFFTMVWSDAHWMQPGMITRRAPDKTARCRERDIYVKQQDVEAQLVAAALFERKRAVQYLVNALERKPGPHDLVEAAGDGQADGQLKIDFHIPAAARWVEHNAQKLYDELMNVQSRDWYQGDLPPFAVHFEQPVERWNFWEKRLLEIQREEEDDVVKKAAESALEFMRDVDSRLPGKE